jgi:hypothetical protein
VKNVVNGKPDCRDQIAALMEIDWVLANNIAWSDCRKPTQYLACSPLCQQKEGVGCTGWINCLIKQWINQSIHQSIERLID